MITLHGHEDGLGLNDIIRIKRDARDPDAGGASHHYVADIEYAGGRAEVLEINFQHGPRKAETSTPGVTEAVMYAIIIDRLESFQAGPFACEANAKALVLARQLRDIERDRAIERAHRGVLGENKV